MWRCLVRFGFLLLLLLLLLRTAAWGPGDAAEVGPRDRVSEQRPSRHHSTSTWTPGPNHVFSIPRPLWLPKASPGLTSEPPSHPWALTAADYQVAVLFARGLRGSTGSASLDARNDLWGHEDVGGLGGGWKRCRGHVYQNGPKWQEIHGKNPRQIRDLIVWPSHFKSLD